MQSETHTRHLFVNGLRSLLENRFFALTGFLVTHLVLVWLGLVGKATPMGDITFAYEPWARQMQTDGMLLGLTQPWVYPFPNLLLVLMPNLTGFDYQTTWLIISGAISVLVASAVLFASKAPLNLRVLAVWVWSLCLLVLGPVSISRLDSASVAVAILAVMLWNRDGIARRVSAGVLAVAVWLKVWPIALFIAALAASKNRLGVLSWFLFPAFAIAALGFILGGNSLSIFSFFTQQSNRGIQIESPWAAPWLWAGVAGSKAAGLYFDQPLLTFQVFGAGTEVFANLLGLVMFGALMITAVLGYRASKAAFTPSAVSTSSKVFAWTAMTAVLDLIVFNKVGSPQYYGWLVAPLLFGVLAGVWRLRDMGIWVVAICGLTGLIYPVIYDNILTLQGWAVGVLTLRNLAAIALLVYCNLKLSALAKAAAPAKGVEPGKTNASISAKSGN